MKIIQRNKVKFKVFEEDELKYQLGMNDDETNLVLEYQDKFPELMREDCEGFCIDGENLRKLLNISKKLLDWIKPYIKDNNSYGFAEDIDFTSEHVDVSVRFSKEEIKNMNPNQRSKHGIKTKIMLTLDMAKELCMISRSNEGKLCRKYFILIEKTLKSYENWNRIRVPEKEKANEMKQEIKKWCERKGFDSTLETFYTRDFNMLNQNLTNLKASELRSYFNCKTGITRDYLIEKYNSALLFIQEFNIQLLLADVDFETRDNMIKNICDNKYKYLKIN